MSMAGLLGGDQVILGAPDWPHSLALLFWPVRWPQGKGLLSGEVWFHLRLFLDSLGMFAVILNICSLDQQQSIPWEHIRSSDNQAPLT